MSPKNLIYFAVPTLLKKKFPGIFDKRERLQLIDYDKLSIYRKENINNSKFSVTDSISNRSWSTVKKRNNHHVGISAIIHLF